MSAHVVTSHVPVIRYMLEPRALFIFPPTVTEMLQRTFVVFARALVQPVRRRLKLVSGLAKMPYYITIC